MRVVKWMTGSLVGIALLGSSVAAEARPRHNGGWNQGGWGNGGGWGHHRRRDRDGGFGVGDAIGVAAIIGAVAIVASSMSKDKKAREGRTADGEPPRDDSDYGRDMREAGHDAADFSDIAAADQDRMTDDCARAARDEAQAGGGYAEVRQVDPPVATHSGYNIDGEIETRASYRADAGTTRRFTCSIADGRVADVYLSREVATR